jgi:Mg2+/Co2+ transporter CorB
LNDIPLGTLGLALIVLLVTAGFFSIAETAMMAANRGSRCRCSTRSTSCSA